MGLLVDGKWHDQWYDTKSSGGRFIRSEAQYRNWVTADGTPGPSGEGGFKAEAGRYHLYVSLACPWAHRTLIVRHLKGLEDLISVSVVHWLMREDGWTFADGPAVVPDPLGAKFMYEVYTRDNPAYSGRVTVPVLWDTHQNRIVSNESSEIIRMFNEAFDDLGAKVGHYYPDDLRAEIDAVNARVYDTVNNGVYKAGFATTQDAYDDAVGPLFDSLNWLEDRLSRTRYLIGNVLTEADIRLFTTLIRFDPVYVGHFKCNLRRIADYPNLSAYVRDIFQTAGIAATVNFEHIKGHYYQSHLNINPTGIVPNGPILDMYAPHNRSTVGS
ncbi:glutathione S-transferase family protein [Asticcacaulis machinosus]|uniref:Glutathione S-transferase family protein n=1 Tax=Asticcacaulis machinosus TaxID=2984211 RepID=A0ABT5HL41_9CAUL|nr:glutathione S-transferase family protein [Asticcacaulis machinosus]MDC7676703.1 glutathione S-transferase family protein [Asticcacaulis machinosus]